MTELKYFKSACILNALLLFLQYISALVFFVTQGSLITMAISHKAQWLSLSQLIIVFISSKALMLIADVIKRNIVDYISVREINYQFLQCFPRQLYRDQAHLASHFFTMINDNFNKLIRYKLGIYNNRITFVLVGLIYFSFLIYSHFNLGGILVLVLFFLVFLNQYLWGNKVDKHLADNERHKRSIMTWIDEYFRSFREINRIWPKAIKTQHWAKQILSNFARSKEKLVNYFLIMNSTSQLLVEIPFIAITGFIILEVYWQQISLALAFAWFGIAQFILQASQGLAKNIELKKNYQAQYNEIDTFFSAFSAPAKRLITAKVDDHADNIYEFTLQNKSIIRLSTHAGIQLIDAPNGAGKTTLLDTLLDYDRHASFHQTKVLQAYKMAVLAQEIKLIDRKCVVFHALSCFSQQITGPEQKISLNACCRQIKQHLEIFCTPSVSEIWVTRLQQLGDAYDKRSEKSLSTGEKVLLSWARNWFAWQDNVRILIMDECDAVLDRDNQALLYKTLIQLAEHIAIYMVSHTLAQSGLDKLDE
ncbi:MAG: ATP-binding cassette domain-containing protein [Psychromonas sp.]|nr:ATP-binding cassette domain-containing protein [Psychromonas sp.]